MTIQEFILIDKDKVRRDSNLIHLYLEFFKTAFGRVPNCAGCSFGTDWQKLINFHTGNKEKSVTLQKQKVMNTISIKKIQGKILTYRKEGKTYRMYDNILTDSFIKEYVSNGTEEEIKERLKMFNFPVEAEESKKIEQTIKIVIDNAKAYENNEIIETPNGIADFKNKPLPPKKRGRKPKK